MKPLKAIDQLDYAAEKILEAGGYIYTDPKADEQVKALLVKIEALRDYLGEGEKTMTKSKEEQLQAIYDTSLSLAGYGITDEEIQAEAHQYLIDFAKWEEGQA